MKPIAIIPARAGSTRIPGKNFKKFHGQPIIQYSIDAAHNTELFSKVIVSTDHMGIANLADDEGCYVHWREGEMAQDHIGTQAVAKMVIDDVESFGWTPDHACVIYATAPLLHYGSLIAAYGFLLDDFRRQYVFSVGENPLHDAGQFYFGRRKAFIDESPLIWYNTMMFPIDSDRDCDINTITDWVKASMMYEKLQKEGRI